MLDHEAHSGDRVITAWGFLMKIGMKAQAKEDGRVGSVSLVDPREDGGTIVVVTFDQVDEEAGEPVAQVGTPERFRLMSAV